NPIVLRSSFSDSATFDAFLSQMRAAVVEAFERQDYPFSLLVENLRISRDAGRPPFVQAMFVYQKAHLPNQDALAGFAVGEPGARVTIGRMELESVPLNRKVTEFDLTLKVTATDGGGIHGSFEYSADLFEAVTITRMASHFERLVDRLVAEPAGRMSAL